MFIEIDYEKSVTQQIEVVFDSSENEKVTDEDAVHREIHEEQEDQTP